MPGARRFPRPEKRAISQVSEDAVVPLARKLVALAKEQQHALELGAREQFDWIAVRRDDVTERLSKLLAAEVQVTAQEADELQELRGQLLAIDASMEGRLSAQMEALSAERRSFSKARKALGAYLASPRRRAVVDKRQ
jgi:DNA gyrase/topoisomerase IV subunit A